MKCVILDMDGTLSDATHRIHHITDGNRDWDSFFGAMHEDKAIESIAWLAKFIIAHAKAGEPDPDFASDDIDHVAVLVVTARPDDHNYREVTERWLLDNEIHHAGLYMRKGGDFRPDHVVKAEILNQILNDGYEPILAIDDKSNITEMWRSFGITALQCAGDEPRRSKYAGQTLFHMLVGPSGCGKSTYCEQNYKPSDIVSSDEARVQLFGSHELGHNAEDLARTWKYVHGMIKTRLECGVFTVLDATNLKHKDRMAALENVPEGVMVRYIVLDREYNDKLKTRGWRPEQLIRKHHQTFQSNIKDILAGDGQPNVVVVDKRQHKV